MQPQFTDQGALMGLFLSLPKEERRVKRKSMLMYSQVLERPPGSWICSIHNNTFKYDTRRLKMMVSQPYLQLIMTLTGFGIPTVTRTGKKSLSVNRHISRMRK